MKPRLCMHECVLEAKALHKAFSTEDTPACDLSRSADVITEGTEGGAVTCSCNTLPKYSFY